MLDAKRMEWKGDGKDEFNIFKDLRKYRCLANQGCAEEVLLATHRGEAASCVVIAFQRHLDSFDILLESQTLNKLYTCRLCPVFSVNGRDANTKIILKDAIKDDSVQLRRSL